MKMEYDRNGLVMCLFLIGTAAKIFGVTED